MARSVGRADAIRAARTVAAPRPVRASRARGRDRACRAATHSGRRRRARARPDRSARCRRASPAVRRHGDGAGGPRATPTTGGASRRESPAIAPSRATRRARGGSQFACPPRDAERDQAMQPDRRQRHRQRGKEGDERRHEARGSRRLRHQRLHRQRIRHGQDRAHHLHRPPDRLNRRRRIAKRPDLDVEPAERRLRERGCRRPADRRRPALDTSRLQPRRRSCAMCRDTRG